MSLKTLNGLAIASVKTFNGLAIASVKTVNGRQASGGGGFTPPAGCLLWLEARDLALADGDPVGSLSDKSGNGNNASAAGSERPTKQTVSGRTVIRFDGSDDWLTGAVTVSGTTLTVFALTTLNSGSTSYGRVVSLTSGSSQDYSSSARCAAILRDSSSQAITSYRNGGLSSKAITYGTRHIMVAKFDGTNHTMYVDGSAATSVASTGTFAVDKYALGREADHGPDKLSGDIEAVFIFSGALSDSDRTSVETYLASL